MAYSAATKEHKCCTVYNIFRLCDEKWP